MPYDKERVSRRLKSLRSDLGWEQEDLAARAGVSKSVVVNAETARTGMNLDTAFDLTEAMGCTLEQLVCRDGREAG